MIRLVNHAVQRRLVFATCPVIDDVATVDNEDILESWNRDLALRFIQQDFETFAAGLLQ